MRERERKKTMSLPRHIFHKEKIMSQVWGKREQQIEGGRRLRQLFFSSLLSSSFFFSSLLSSLFLSDRILFLFLSSNLTFVASMCKRREEERRKKKWTSLRPSLSFPSLSLSLFVIQVLFLLPPHPCHQRNLVQDRTGISTCIYQATQTLVLTISMSRSFFSLSLFRQNSPSLPSSGLLLPLFDFHSTLRSLSLPTNAKNGRERKWMRQKERERLR